MKTISRSLPLILAASILPCMSVTAAPKEPDYPCYMRTSSGRVINLTQSLCSSSKTTAPLPSVATTAPQATTKSAIEFAGIEFSYQTTVTGASKVKAPLIARGQIANHTNSTITVATITAKQGDNVVQVEANAQVKPGESATFEEAGTRGRPKIGVIDDVVSWVDLFNEAHTDGFAGCQYISNVNENEKHCKYH